MENRFAVMGNPIAHSLSPLIHQHFAKQFSIALSYEKIHVDIAFFEAQVSHFFLREGKGLNITLPFKERAYTMAASCTARCLQAKAANTLWQSGGKLHADNTDGIGLIRDLGAYLKLPGKRVLLLGAGGAARGVIGPLLEANIGELILVNRTQKKADDLQVDFPAIKTASISQLHDPFDLIINATSASLAEEEISLPQGSIIPTTLCYDLAYNLNKPTPFVDWAKKRGLHAVDGLGMLIEQAAEAFYIWHGLRPDIQRALKFTKALKT